MRQRVTASAKLTAMILVSLIATDHSIAAAQGGTDGTVQKEPQYKISQPKKVVPNPKAVLGGNRSVRNTVELALPFLEQAGEAWIEKRQCVSCHQVPFMLWSLSAADARGYQIDRSGLRKWTTWSTDVRNFVKPAQKPDMEVSSTLAANVDTVNALLLAIPAQQQPTEASEPQSLGETDEGRPRSGWRKIFAESLVKNQQEQGDWKSCGQLPAQKRPIEETTQVTTAWTLLALDNSQATAARERQALESLQNPSPVSTEWWAVRLLLAETRAEMDAAAISDALVQNQKSDGGWGWLTSDSSDALATGMALYALSRHDRKRNKESISKAVSFLTRNQSADGSWKVPGTKKTTRNKPTPTSNYWGTAWAVIGLLESELQD